MLKWHATYKTNYDGTPRPTYDGAVLDIGSTRTVQVMSDVWGTESYATVWDGEKITTVATSLSDDMGYRVYADASVDATPAVRAAARAFTVARKAADLKLDWERNTDRVAAYATKLERGKTVIVARGRKVPKGTTGELFWLGHGKFGLRAGVKDAAGNVHWTAASNLDVVNPDDYIAEIPVKPTDAEFAARAEAIVPPLSAAFSEAA